MKKRLLLFSALFAAGAVSAQFTTENAPEIGDSIQLYIVDSTANNFKAITGDGVTWDYTNLDDYEGETRFIAVIDPQDTTYGATFTNSDKAIEIEGGFMTFVTDVATKRTSQGVVYHDATLGDLTINLDDNEGTYYEYPFDFGDEINDTVEGHASFMYNSMPISTTAIGYVHTKVDGRGTLKIGLNNVYDNVLRYHIIDTIRLVSPLPGLDDYLDIHEQFEYYDFTVSNLPIFTHSHLWFGPEGGTPRNDFNFVLSKDIKTTAVSNEALLAAKVYPNPASSFVNIELPNEITNAKVSIVDAIGRVVVNTTVNSGFSKIDVSALNEGTYFVKIAANDMVTTQTLILK